VISLASDIDLALTRVRAGWRQASRVDTGEEEYAPQTLEIYNQSGQKMHLLPGTCNCIVEVIAAAVVAALVAAGVALMFCS
jgi:hypothetical protein